MKKFIKFIIEIENKKNTIEIEIKSFNENNFMHQMNYSEISKLPENNQEIIENIIDTLENKVFYYLKNKEL